MMEALQMLKFALKQQRNPRNLNFISDWCTPMSMLEDPDNGFEPDVDVLSKWFGAAAGTKEYDDGLDNILADVGN